MDKLAMNFTPFYVMANVRSMLSGAHAKRTPNWVLACNIFAVGSTTAMRVCREAGIDPFGFEVTTLATPTAETVKETGQ